MQVTSYLWVKCLSAKGNRYIPKCWERFVKTKSYLNFLWILKKKKKKWWKFWIYLIQTFVKMFCWRYLVPSSEHILVISKTLSFKTQNILTLSSYYTIKQTAFVWYWKYLLIYLFDIKVSITGLFGSLSKMLIVMKHPSFFI